MKGQWMRWVTLYTDNGHWHVKKQGGHPDNKQDEYQPMIKL